jgi:polar amino acid transport system substrate-binding protein
MVLAVVAFAGCEPDSTRPGETTLDRVKREKSIRIAYANEAPFGYLDVESGKVTGEAPEIARAILSRMGITSIETTLTDFGQLIPGLKAGRFDIIAAGMYITPARCRQIAFSNPTYAIGEAFLVKKGNPRRLHSYEDVRKHEQARLGVVGGTIELRYAESMKISDERLVVFPDNAAALAALKAGRIDAFGGTALTVQDLLNKSGDARLERAEPFEQPNVNGRVRNYGAMGFRKDDTRLLAEFNRHLGEFIGSKEHLELVRPFGFTEKELPQDVTARELCTEP